jgi:hypothetical protein
MTVNILIQIDKLVQLLESPVFTCMVVRRPNFGKPLTTETQTYGSNSSSPNGTPIYTSASTAS